MRGANFACIYGKTKAMGYRNVTLPKGHTWKSYTLFLLDTLPARLRNNYVKKFNTSIQFWHETGGVSTKRRSGSWRNTAITSAATAFPTIR